MARPPDWRKLPSSIGAMVGFGIANVYYRPPFQNIRDCSIVDAVALGHLSGDYGYHFRLGVVAFCSIGIATRGLI